MSLKDKIKQTLRESYGNFETYLEHKYEDTITNHLITNNIKEQKAWITYNQVILELKNNLKDTLRLRRLQYELTDKTNPNEVCINVLEEIKEKSPELERLYYKISNLSD